MDTATAMVYQGLFERLKSHLLSEDFKRRHRRSEKDFTRQRCLTFTLIVLFLLNLVKRALQDELDEFFKLLKGESLAVRAVTKSAFSQARQKLDFGAFVELNQVQVAYFYEHFESQTWHGFRLLAVDGSTGELPHTAELIEHFGVWHPAAGGVCPVARMSQMFDVLNQVTLDALIAPKDQGERALAAQHFDHLTPGDLVLLDRDYPAFWLFALILSKGADFCVRMPLEGWIAVEHFITAGLTEQSVTLYPSAAALQECHQRGLPTSPLTVRLIRVELDHAEIEVLTTSLPDGQTYPVALFKELYHHRWPAEENYKAMKCRIEIENFSGTSVLAVYQDFHAKVFTLNLAASLAQPARRALRLASPGKKHLYQPNFTYLLSKIKNTVVLLLRQTAILDLLERLWHLMLETVEPVRPGRSYSHKKRVRPKKFPMAYKPVC